MAKTPENKSTLILFVRHGQTETTGQVLPGRAKGLKLSAVGEAQANRLGQVIKVSQHEPSAIYTSPMERTRQTAKLIAKPNMLKPISNKGFTEANFGDWTGRKLSELRKLKDWQRVQHTPSNFRFPNGESFVEIQSRALNSIENLTAEHQNETIMVVSHADTIKMIMANALGIHLDPFQRITINPCSVSGVLYTANRPIVLCVNSIDTLPDSVAAG